MLQACFRKCVGCNEPAEKRELIRVSLKGSAVVNAKSKTRAGGTIEVMCDSLAYRDGRSAYLHPRMSCYEKAVKRKSFGRSFRHAVSDDVMKRVKEMIDERE